jgi:hypothetical protein
MLFSSGDHDPSNWIKGKFVNLVRSIKPDCREVTGPPSQGRDRLAPLGTRLRLAVHRRFGKRCARYARQLDFLAQSE